MTTELSTLRSVELAELVQRLEADQARKVDLVVSADAVTVIDGRLLVQEGDQVIRIKPGRTMLDTMAQRIKLPATLLRELADNAEPAPLTSDPIAQLSADRRPDAYRSAFDSLVGARITHDGPRRFLLRTYCPDMSDPFRGPDHHGRAFLSDRFNGLLDNRDVLVATLQGVTAAMGTDPVRVVHADLTDARMRVRIEAPGITAVATELLKGYRSPFRRGHDGSPLVSAGLEVANSELGLGAFTITPEIRALVCDNGMVQKVDQVRSTHRGALLEQGEIDWANDTRQAQIEVIRLKARDAVAAFLTTGYLEATVARIEALAGHVIAEPSATVERISTAQNWSDGEARSILDLFIAGGQNTAGGILNAITAHAQNVADPERAAELNYGAMDALAMAAV